MQDQYGRTIDYLRISVTDFCNLRCHYCMPAEGVLPVHHDDKLTLEELYHITHLFVENGITKVRITGGEPLIRKGIEYFIASLGLLHKIKDLTMTTNALLLTLEKAQRLKAGGLTRVNISLDSLDQDSYRRITRGGDFAAALDGLRNALQVGFKVKINVVLLKDINDREIVDFVELTKKYPIDVRFIEVMPIGPTAHFSKKHYMSAREVLEKVALTPLETQEKSSPARLYTAENAIGRVGLIRPLSCRFCHECNRLRLTSDGQLKPCLLSDLSIDLKTPLRNGEDLQPYLDRTLSLKPEKHHVEEGNSTSLPMHRIGG
ncbi:MAG TPA: GTP 3',8-cyclase MoaA [Clostridiaceae bacterium]|nr:GTP 3',8-cyclase MoaA [Clostridiaceae bacterium]